MIIRRGKINNKEKQFAAGNWSTNQFVKKHTKISDPLLRETPKHRSNKKKMKPDYEAKWHGCPFCQKALPVVRPVDTVPQPNGFYRWIFEQRASKCACGAKIVMEACPSCKRDTWFKAGIYKHQGNFNCGFFGKRISPKNLSS